MIFLLPLVFAGLLAAEGAALNLTPIPHQKQMEGIPMDDVAFRYGADIVTYSPPSGWQASGDERRAVFRPTKAEAEATIEVKSKPEDTSFSPDVVKSLKEALDSTLPRQA